MGREGMDVRTVPRVAGAQTRGDLGLGDPLFYLQRSNVEDLLRISILSGFYIYARAPKPYPCRLFSILGISCKRCRTFPSSKAIAFADHFFSVRL